GLALGVGLGQAAKALLYALSAYDPVVLGGAVAVLAIVVLAAGDLPARRAAAVAPMEALRYEGRSESKGGLMNLRQTVRALGKTPGFTIATVLTLAIGIGATTAIFSVVKGVLLNPLPFPEPDRLISVNHRSKNVGPFDMNASPALYLTY